MSSSTIESFELFFDDESINLPAYVLYRIFDRQAQSNDSRQLSPTNNEKIATKKAFIHNTKINFIDT